MKKHIPNILSIIRILLIPLFVYTFVRYPDDRIICMLVFCTASLTDVLDGFLARKFGWITKLGKILDPIADKSMQLTVLICLTTANGFFKWILILFLLKEATMMIGALIVLRRKNDIVSSMWYGKAATVAFFAISCVFLISGGKSLMLNTILCILLAAVLIFALLMYYFKLFRAGYGITKIKKEKTK